MSSLAVQGVRAMMRWGLPCDLLGGCGCIGPKRVVWGRLSVDESDSIPRSGGIGRIRINHRARVCR